MSGKEYWRSLDELADTPEFRAIVEQELGAHGWDRLSAPSRRDFMKVMGASLALAGLTACRWPQEKIVPLAYREPGRIPGVPDRFATSMEIGGIARALLATSYDGRPTKIEGNSEHPMSLGGADAPAQASVLELYDPDRSKVLRSREDGQDFTRSWDEFEAFARNRFQDLRNDAGAGFYVLAEASSSPSVHDMWARLMQLLPRMKWYEYETLSRDNERAGAALAFGRPYRALLHLDKAAVIVGFDADFLLEHPAAVRYARDFAAGRRADDGTMNRLYAIESAMTVTGSMADHRFAARPALMPVLMRCLAAELFVAQGLESPFVTPEVKGLLERYRATASQFSFIGALSRDLMKNRGRGLVVVGPRQRPDVHVVAHVINLALGNVGETVAYAPDADPDRVTHTEAVRQVASDIRGGKVSTLLILGGNPAYDAPADLDFAKLIAKVKSSIHLGLYDDETSDACTWHLPRAHYLEAWGDARSFDGTLTFAQPLIQPLYEGKSVVEVLSMLMDEPPVKGYEIVRRTFAQSASGAAAAAVDFEKQWRRAIHDGFTDGGRIGTETPSLQPQSIAAALAGDASAERAPSGPEQLDVVYVQDASLHDGRYANNAWLQEMPDPLTKLTWDNTVLLAPAAARDLGVAQGDVVELQLGGRTIEGPVSLMPGQARECVVLPLGYGRTKCGRVGDGVGFDAFRLRTSDAMDAAKGLRVVKTGRTYKLATTQDHHLIDPVGLRERETRLAGLLRRATIEEYRKNPDVVEHRVETPPLISLWKEHEYEGHRWAMSIDLSACTGCSACVVACQAENNIPVVGKDQVARGREMHWIRVDRYFSGEVDRPSVLHQVVTCHQCENAPCEQVCPVGATQHSHEGLNDMVYNRCIGTRYCSNNCPYKVRRFNWFNNHKHISELEKMVYNPDVTVRSRGVMEKCTYCVQRINAVKIVAKNERRPIADGEITPACAQTCPTQAIVFGDLNDPNSRVRKLRDHRRSYAMLAELNVKPRTTYLAKLTNPSAEESS